MIRSVPYRVLRASMTPEAFQALMATKHLKDLELEQAVKVIAAKWKAGKITAKEKDAQEAPIYDAYRTWALENGIYIDTTPEQDEAEEETHLSDIIEGMTPSRILKIMTRITNYYRAHQDPPKTSLSAAQVKKLLS